MPEQRLREGAAWHSSTRIVSRGPNGLRPRRKRSPLEPQELSGPSISFLITLRGLRVIGIETGKGKRPVKYPSCQRATFLSAGKFLRNYKDSTNRSKPTKT